MASSTRKPFAIGDKVFNQIMPAFEWAKAKETRIMNNVPIEKRGITVTLNPTNSHALRLLAALSGKSQKNLVDEFLCRGGLVEALQTAMEGINPNGSIPHQTSGVAEIAVEIASLATASEEEEDDPYGEIAALRGLNQQSPVAGTQTNSEGTLNPASIGGMDWEKDGDIPW